MKAWTIAFKDIVTRLRDRKAILLMVVTPLILTAIIGAAFSGVLGNQDEAPIQNVALVIVNDDQGDMGRQIVDVLQDPELADLLEPTTMSDLETARARVETGGAIAVVYIPPDFSANIQQRETSGNAATSDTKIQLYTDPVNAIQASIVEIVVSQIVASFNNVVLATQVSIEQVMAHTTSVDVATVAALAEKEIQATFDDDNNQLGINLDRGATAGNANSISGTLSYMALSLTIFFLTFSLFDNIRSLLDEQREGTLDRLLTTNTGIGHILLGKIGGTLISGVFQLAVLIVATRLLFNLGWGRSILGLILMILAIAAAVTSLGTFLAAFTRDSRQAGILAGAIVAVSAALGGSFFSPYGFSGWLQMLSYLTINRWAMDGLRDLILQNLPLQDVLLEIAVLFGIAGILFVLSVWRFPQRIKR